MLDVRRTVLTAALVAFLPLTSPVRAGDPPAAKDKVRQEIENRLDTMKISCDFDTTEVVDVIDFLRSLTDLNLTYSKAAREVVEESPAPTVSLTVKELRLREVLRFILDQNDLTAVYRDGVLVISTKAEVEHVTVTKTYDVRDLLMKIRDFPGPEIELKTDGEAENTGGFIPEQPEPAYDSLDELIDTLKKAVAPETWDSAGYSMSGLNGMLVVTHSRKTHEEVKNLLDMLRRAK